MVTESGGKVTDIEGGASALEGGSILASNTDLHPTLLDKLKAAG